MRIRLAYDASDKINLYLKFNEYIQSVYSIVFQIALITHSIHALKNLPFQFTPVTHMVYLEIQLLEVNFSMAKSK